jgi:BirA family biotin operon repressor/biotin-[acetyl-CoA-carboxylase] ligase
VKRPGIPAAASALGLLADGANHSGEQIAVQLGISRAAVWKQIQKLRQLGVQIEAVRGSGYCLTQPIELLDRQRILHEIGDAARARLERLDVVTVIDSTNSALLTGPRPVPGKLWACLAEYQRGGRGRRGRAWLAPLGRGLCMSVAWTFAGQPGDFAALGLAAGVAVRRALLAQTGLPIRIKWPNDLLVADR